MLSDDDYKGFWVMQDEEGFIRVGQSSIIGENEIMMWQDSEPLELSGFGVMTGWGPPENGVWVEPITGSPEHRMTEVSPRHPCYRGHAPAIDRGISFQVRAKNDAHIGLFPSIPMDPTSPFYEIVLSGWGNTQSVIRRGSQGRNQVTKSTKGLLSQTEMRTFVVRQTAGGSVEVYKDEVSEDNLLMSWQDPEPLQIASVGCMTGWGADGYWKWPEWGVNSYIAHKSLNEVEVGFYEAASWKVASASGDVDKNCVTLENVENPGYWLRWVEHGDQAAVVMSANDESEDFKISSIWCFVQGVSGRGASLVAVDGEHYLYHKGYQLFAAPMELIKLRNDAGFWIRDALSGGGSSGKNKGDDEESSEDPVDKPDDDDQCGYGCTVKGKGEKVKEKTLQKFFKNAAVTPSMACMCGEYCSSEGYAVWYLKVKPGQKEKYRLRGRSSETAKAHRG
eukprot:TRINITY_DN645_c0_g1_i4.p1 TRINITY_DN645_c0_g1~~TRINITY_DN645_c0_g1_i4.p1  ORF type:complete len:449 (+),score=100.32 TRINITY_DN645_c0_g1_i4:40-1386(+)